MRRLPGPELRRLAHAAIDVSDGLVGDLAHICEESGVGAVIHAESMPVARGSTLYLALHGGDDYELLFTVRPRQRGRLRGARRRIGDLPITRIGVVTRALDLRGRDATGTHEVPHGFEHFR